MPYIYFFALLVFLFFYTFFLTLQLYKSINLELSFKKIKIDGSESFTLDQFFDNLKILSSKKLWLQSIELIERQKDIEIGKKHNYFNAVGFIYQNMGVYDLARLYYLQSLNKKEDYIIALNNLFRLYNRK